MLYEAMASVLTKCDILLDNCVISKEELMGNYWNYLSQTLGTRKHNIGMTLHTGSDCFAALTIAYAALFCYLENDLTPALLVESLSLGDGVLCGEKRREPWIFQGIETETDGLRLAVLVNGTNRWKVPEKNWRFIVPDSRKTRSSDGRGLRKKDFSLRNEFLSQVLGMDVTSVVSMLDASCIFLISRSRADHLVKGISFRFNGKTVKLLDLVTASYYTDNEIYYFSGNGGKNEATLKFATHYSAISKYLYRRGVDGQFNRGVFVMGAEIVRANHSIIQELYDRVSLPNVHVLTEIDSAVELIQYSLDREKLGIFACTKDFLINYGGYGITEENDYTIELEKQVSVILNNNVQQHQVSAFESGTWEKYRSFKRKLSDIRNTEHSSDAKNNFIIQAHTLMNLFTTVTFPISVLDEASISGIISVEDTETRLFKLREYMKEFSSYSRERAAEVVEFLETIYLEMAEMPPKAEFLRNMLTSLSVDETVALVVPRAYFSSVIHRLTQYIPSRVLERLAILTPNQVAGRRIFNRLILSAGLYTERFDLFHCRTAENIEVMLYPYERNTFYYRQKESLKLFEQLDTRSFLPVDLEPADIPITEEEIKQVEETEEATRTVETYLQQQITIPEYASQGTRKGTRDIKADVTHFARFTTGEAAFFTKYYKAYVFNEQSDKVELKEAKELLPGDMLIFPLNNNDTHDIVDTVLMEKMRIGGIEKAFNAHYERAGQWRKLLKQYMLDKDLTVSEVAERLIKTGVSVGKQTIRGWLDEGSHTVGPQDKDDVKHIGELTQFDDMRLNPSIYYESISIVRGVRRKILEQIKAAIMDQLGNNRPTVEAEYADIYDRLDSIAILVEVEGVHEINRQMLQYDTNHLIYDI